MPESLHRIVGHGSRPGVCCIGVPEDLITPNAFTLTPFVFATGLLGPSEANGFPSYSDVEKAIAG